MSNRVYPSYFIYKDSSGYWRWRYDAGNMKTISVSSESYYNKYDCEHAISLVKNSLHNPVYE
ncbi:MAG TPA: DUF1508 domain-containing protein [Aestuariivirga sp.]|nr:DUF1508 domain-containing protein [Aestuariivirga sp.]